MLHLAIFFQILIDRTPGSERYDSARAIEANESVLQDVGSELPPGDYEPGLMELESGGDVGESNEDHASIPQDAAERLASMHFEVASTHIHGNELDYRIASQVITFEIASEIVEVYRRGGKLNIDSVHQLLRTSYQVLKTLRNTIHMTVPTGTKVTIAGDTHGQLSDLLHILDESGYPSATNKYVFNGDYVDRGLHSVEVFCILMAFLCANPHAITLNRGNHEDVAVSRVYGFQNEVLDKYNELTFCMFVEVFRYLPLFTVIENSIFVVHGGMFKCPSLGYDDDYDDDDTHIISCDYYTYRTLSRCHRDVIDAGRN
jgi:Calcineurin-like phosphoesterase